MPSIAKTAGAKADFEGVDLVERAIDVLEKLGATVVDPGPEETLFQVVHREGGARASCRQRSCGSISQQGDPIASLVEMPFNLDQRECPTSLTLRTLGGGFGDSGEDKVPR